MFLASLVEKSSGIGFIYPFTRLELVVNMIIKLASFYVLTRPRQVDSKTNSFSKQTR